MKQVSIKKVAEIAGVSIATVSRCINYPSRVKEATRKKVQDAIAQTGYSPNTIAQSFRRGSTNVIMVVVPSIGDPFFTGVLQGIQAVIQSRGYTLIISETQLNTMTADEVGAVLVSRQADGVILLASVFPFGRDVLDQANAQSQPIVVGCETLSAALAEFPSVHIDNVAAATQATDYLVSQGHSRIAFITGQTTSLLTRDRQNGYEASMLSHGLEIKPGWVVEGNLTIDGAAIATRQLLDHADRPTAIFCANDEMAIGCMHEIRNQSLNVPEDISVMGFDDIRYAEAMNPPLTTIAQPAVEIGERVANRMIRSIESGVEAFGMPEIVQHELIIRKSVAAPRT